MAVLLWLAVTNLQRDQDILTVDRSFPDGRVASSKLPQGPFTIHQTHIALIFNVL